MFVLGSAILAITIGLSYFIHSFLGIRDEPYSGPPDDRSAEVWHAFRRFVIKAVLGPISVIAFLMAFVGYFSGY